MAGRVRWGQVWTGRGVNWYSHITEQAEEGYDPVIFQRKPHISPEEHHNACPLMCGRGKQKRAKCSQKRKQTTKHDACTATRAEVQTNRVIEDARSVVSVLVRVSVPAHTS